MYVNNMFTQSCVIHFEIIIKIMRNIVSEFTLYLNFQIILLPRCVHLL